MGLRKLAQEPKVRSSMAQFGMNWGKIVRIIRSMTFAVILLSFIAVAALVGVMMPDQDLAQHWIYHSWWFQGILVFLVLDLLLALFTHRDRSIRYLAYFGTHAGLITVIAGFGIMGYFGIEGYLDIPVGGKKNELGKLQPVKDAGPDHDPNSKMLVLSGIKLPFEVELEKFDIDYYPRPDPVLICDVADKNETQKIALDREANLRDSRYKIEVLEQLASAKRSYRVLNDGQVATQPAVKVRLFVGAEAQDGYLFSDRPAIPVSESPLVVVDYDHLPSAASAAQKTAELRESLRTFLQFEDEEKKTSSNLPLAFGKEQKVGGTGWKVKVLRLVSGVKVDLETRKIEELTGPPVNPAVFAKITAPDGRFQERYVFANPPPPMMEARLRGEFQQLNLRFSYVPPLGKELFYLYLYSLPDGTFHARYFRNEDTVVPAALNRTQPTEIGQSPLRMQILEFLPDPRIQLDVEPLPEGGEPAVRMRITGPLGSQEKWAVLDDEQPAAYEDGNFFVRYLRPEAPIKQFHATVNILENGQPAARGIISVNSPLSYKGYRLFQVDYDQKAGRDSRYSVIKAVYNPGMPVLYAGFGMLALGVIGMVLTKPKEAVEKD
jgi:ResB-like family protein